MQSPMVLDDDKKRELIANMDQGRVNALRKVCHHHLFLWMHCISPAYMHQRAQELSQAGHTKENSTELARALAILQMHHRAVQIEEMKKKHQANEANAGNAAAGPSARTYTSTLLCLHH